MTSSRSERRRRTARRAALWSLCFLAALAAGARAALAQEAGAGSPLSHSLSPYWALAVGAIGSLAYLLAAYLGLIGADGAARNRILEHFRGRRGLPVLKVLAFVAVGGGVAMVFQATERFLVPVQAFILGCTWPAVVSNYVSARQAGADQRIEADVARILREHEETRARLEALSVLPSEDAPAADRRDEIDALLEELPPR